MFTPGFGGGSRLGGWRMLTGTEDQWSVEPGSSALRVDSPDPESPTYLVSPPVPALDGAYRVRAKVKIAEPDRGQTTSSVDLLLNTEDLVTAYLARFRYRNGIRYFTLVKRVAGTSETLVDDIVGFDFDRWLDVDIALVNGVFEVNLEGRQAVRCAEFARLFGGAVAIGASGATGFFDAVDVVALGPAETPPETTPGVPAPMFRTGTRDVVRTTTGTVENAAYRVELVEWTWDGGAEYSAELSVRQGGAWRRLNGDDRWVVLEGESGSRRDLYSSLTTHRVTFTECELVDDSTARLRATDPYYFDLTVTWDLAAQHPRVRLALVPKVAGKYVIGYLAFEGRPLEQVDEVLCGPMQHAKMVRTVESIGRDELSAPVCMVQYTENAEPVTVGLFAPAAELPFEHEPSMGDEAQPFGMSLRNDRGEVQPVLFAPQYGRLAAMSAGGEYRFEVGLYAARKELFEAYRELLRTEYGYRPYRANVFGASLTDTIHNIIDLLDSGPADDDSVEYRPSPSGWWNRAKGFIDIENDRAVRATTTSVLLSAYYLTADDELYERRALPTIQYHVSRNGYGWTPRLDRTVYGDPTKNRLCAVPFGAPAIAPLYSMTSGRMPVLWDLALNRRDDHDYWLKRTPMGPPLAEYRMTKDPATLSRAEELAREYIAREVEPSYTGEIDPHDFQIYYSKAWGELLEMYEETGDRTYLDASYREAKRYVTQVFVRPVPRGTVTVPARPLILDSQLGLKGRWHPRDLYAYPKTDIDDEEVPCWIVSPNGMSFEALKTYRLNGYSMNPAWAPFLLRLASYVDDDLLRDVAHNAVVGRYTNYPGYYFRQFSVNHMKPDFPYVGPFRNTSIYYHHVPVQLGMTIDYLLTEHQTRSKGEIAFPSEYEQNYVWFSFRVYGHRPGTFYGYDGAWLWMPRGLVTTDNEQINWIAAEDGSRLFVSLSNESDATENVRVRLDGHAIPLSAGSAHRCTVVRDNGEPIETTMTGDTFATTVSPHGITALIVHDAGPFDVPLHVANKEGSAPAGGYHLDNDTPVGAVWGMLLVKPDNSRYDAYIQAAAEGSATLHYSTDGGVTFERAGRHVHPNEWTVRVDDMSATFTYYVEVGGRRTDPVELACR